MKITKITINNHKKQMATTFAVVAICLNCREYSGWFKSYRVLVRAHTACLKSHLFYFTTVFIYIGLLL